jgi:preprotein translocase subunit YajC
LARPGLLDASGTLRHNPRFRFAEIRRSGFHGALPRDLRGVVTNGGLMLNLAALVLAATPSQGSPPQQTNFLLMMVPYALIFVVFYFLMIRPARTKQKEHTRMLDALKPGDKVICAGGIHATVAGVTDSTVQVKIADQVRVDVEKASITTVKRSE